MFEQFFIVSMARSGTNYLRDWINAERRYHCLGEIFRSQGDSFQELADLYGIDRPTTEYCARNDKAGLWKQIIDAAQRRGVNPGAKIFYYHANARDPIWDIIDTARVIHLIRLNALAVYVSRELANGSGLWQSRFYKKNYEAQQIVVDPEQFLQLRATRDRQIEWVRDRFAGPRYHEIFYEEFVNARDRSAVVAHAMGARGGWREPSRRTTKQRRRPLSEIVKNYAEVAEFDANTLS